MSDVYEVYARTQRIIDIVAKIDAVLRVCTGVVYILVIFEVLGIPLVRIFEIMSKYLVIMPIMLQPYSHQLLLASLSVDAIDLMFGGIFLIRLGKEKYIKTVITLSTILGLATFCAFPSILYFIFLIVHKIVALYIIMNFPDSVKAMVNFYEYESFEKP